MEKITLNGKRYIALGEFERLRRNLIKDTYDKYEKDEKGQIHLSDIDMGWTAALHHIMVEIMHDELHECGPDREKRDKLYSELRQEAFKGNWCIISKTDDGYAYFRKWCEYVPKDEEADTDDDEPTPVFSNLQRDAKIFTDHWLADVTLRRIRERYPKMSVDIRPAAYLSGDAERRLLDAIFGDDNDIGEYMIRLDRDPDVEDDATMWFYEWIKYRDDMPDELKEIFVSAEKKPGDSLPIFGWDFSLALVFQHRGMAEKQIEKIAAECPDLKDRLHVEEREV